MSLRNRGSFLNPPHSHPPSIYSFIRSSLTCRFLLILSHYFFATCSLHDLNSDGILSLSELDSLYGLKHPASRKAIDDAAATAKRDFVLARVLEEFDSNGDGVISLEEFLVKGAESLPDFPQYEELGHHYSEETEYLMHHDEIYHSTPDTMTDESYNHPEGELNFRFYRQLFEPPMCPTPTHEERVRGVLS